MSGRIRIAVIDDHRIFLDGLSLLLEGVENQFDVEGFDAPFDLLRSVETGAKYDLVICDLIMNAMNGLAFIAALRSHTKTLPILILSGINTLPPIEEIKQLGGNGFVHKSAAHNVLLDAINTVLSGGYYFEDVPEKNVTDAARIFDGNVQSDKGDTHLLPKLGKRQTEILRLIANGATNKEIAHELHISENTVKSHLKNIFVALGVNKRTACVRKAQMLGLI